MYLDKRKGAGISAHYLDLRFPIMTDLVNVEYLHQSLKLCVKLKADAYVNVVDYFKSSGLFWFGRRCLIRALGFVLVSKKKN